MNLSPGEQTAAYNEPYPGADRDEKDGYIHDTVPAKRGANTSNLVNKLRDWTEHDHAALRLSAADEIERLDSLWRTEKARADLNFEENETLREVLKACETHDYRMLADEVERLQAALRLAESARDYANDMLDKARGTGETGEKP